MAFGQQSGPPASTKQIQELLTLLRTAGHTDFRDARGPMGFTQRQAAGRFTREEATDFIDQLQEAEDTGDTSAVVAPTRERSPTVATQGLSPTEQFLTRVRAEQLAQELRRRGWTVNPPRT